MATKGESKKRRLTPTQARAARRARRTARRKWLKYGGGAVALAVAGAFIVSLFLPGLPFGRGGGGHDPAADGAEVPGIRMTSQGTTHIEPGESHPDYNSLPATSGWHYSSQHGVSLGTGSSFPAPVPWGIYNEEIPDEILIHNLEHGGVRIHYNCPGGCPELVSQLVDGARLGRKVVLSPYSNMEATIALAAWNYIDTFEEYDEERIREFIAAHESSANAPEWNVP
jgi:hypothetical protein